ncbi:MAG: signal peptidase [Candidatus Woesearchaeota archaeon]|nr:signal peptidase [Candidatus Woesearchaeota archaeon]MDN5327759.1 signal peptidase [Candidatus Woesearchaeota archaeon]
MAADFNKSKKKGVLFLSLSAILVLADQVLKLLFFRLNPLFEFSLDKISILKIKVVQNPGAAFGLLSGFKGILLVVPILVIGAILINLKRIFNSNKAIFWSFVLILSGSIGNLIDRIIYSRVIDFISVLGVPFFNLADAMISIGLFLLIINQAFSKDKKD